jgi:protein-tyrosine phosphatase
MAQNLYWVDESLPGKVALAARPRGGEWLEDEILAWQRDGVDAIFSLLTEAEERELDISQEAAEARAHGMSFYSFPIQDREVPASEARLAQSIEQVDRELTRGRNVVVHCRQGIGRSGLAAACLLLRHGIDPETAVRRLTAARGIPVPETDEQRRWIDHYAESFAATQ